MEISFQLENNKSAKLNYEINILDVFMMMNLDDLSLSKFVTKFFKN